MLPRGTYPGSPQPPFHPAPNAALLIDFDNVTMAIRSDLGKELKMLLNSDVIRGKVAVQRAYADWRRYPQYIVPLAESSVDLIFAPAYGSAKKNATDLRMAIDAIELVFTRPEIGTFILMTGDSDFSSCVLKLKEYGKYVIGVGMRESSSDLLIQNCDEYYSYHSLSGLTREGVTQESKEDPWVLVKRAVQAMVKNGDVMRTDRLKQVMLDLDPAFDEKKLGYSKFSRFVSEAASKNLLRLKKTENGQYEIIPEGPTTEQRESREKVVERIVAEAEADGNGRRRRGGRDDRERRPREERPAVTGRTESLVPPPVLRPAAEDSDDQVAAPAARAEPPAPHEEAPVSRAEVSVAPQQEERVADVAPSGALDAAYSLLQEAVRRLSSRDGRNVRDGDVKRKMLEIDRAFDETALGFGKFTRFLRQAHDAEVIDLTRAGAGNYEVSLPTSGRKLPPPPAGREGAVEVAGASERKEPRRESRRVPAAASLAEDAATEAPRDEAPAAEAPTRAVAAPAAPVGGMRGRRGGRSGPASGPPPLLPGQVVGAPVIAAPQAEAPRIADSVKAEVDEPTSAQAPEVSGAEAGEAAEKPSRSRRGRGRRGRGRESTSPAGEQDAGDEAAEASFARGGEAEAEPGTGAQVVEAQAVPTPAAEPVREVEAEAAPAATARGRRGRRSRGPALSDAPPPLLEGQVVGVPTSTPSSEPAAAVEERAEDARGAPAPAKRSRRGRGRKRTEEAPGPAAFSAEAIGLPTDPAEIRAYLSSSYKGIGLKTADLLLETFGPDLFGAMRERPEEIRGVLKDRRADTLLDQWAADFERRSGDSAAAAPAEALAEAIAEAPAGEEKPARSSRPRRSPRGRGGKKEPAGSS